MCGFCGVLGTGPDDARGETVARMTATLVHRGPDAGATFVGPGIALGHRRLSILDLSPAGAQPMRLASGVTIAYNGEVYNFLDLRRELEMAGRVFRGHSDTEVILNAYDEWGLDGLRRLEGIFAFGLWDPRHERLVLMRDRLGVKPLFHARSTHGLAFGSEIKAVLAAGGVDRAIDRQSFHEYLWFGNAFEDRTMYSAVRAVPPGHWLIAERGAVRVEAWWRIEDWLGPPAVATYDEGVHAVRAAVDAAVTRQLVADVPVGIFLSGGVDSSAIAATAARHASTRLSSYSVGFDFDRGVNELPTARGLAESLGFDHHELHVGGADLPDVIVALVRAHDEPFADAANLPLFLLARGLERAVKVVLQGDGGDEMFAGYRRYAVLRHARAWSAWPAAATALLRRAGRRGERIARMAAAVGSREAAQRMALLLTVETTWDPPSALLSPEVRAGLEGETDPFLAYRACARRFAAHEPVQQMLLTDIHLQLPSQFLAKVDRATMAQGLEARVPLLDERVAQLAVGLPSAWKVSGTEKKRVLRDAMRDRVPARILDGPKTGFGVPYEHWLRTSLHGFARDAILSPAFLQRFGFDAARVAAALDDHRSGRRERGFMLWKLLQLALWARECAR
ncbi:MAG: asparagine synthase (glutamine-hydrolyzing) [Steroidobacteraceae bacterium]|nr:asparagine synthase (glutamine-hydrolyzing) [Steroidobacteraceae bacterium]